MRAVFSYTRLIGLFLFIFAHALVFAQIPSDGLVGYYMLNGNPADSSGMAHDGTITGTIIPNDNRFNEPDQAYYFEGNCKINCANPVAYQLTDALSVTAWIQPRHFVNWWRTVVSKWAGPSSGGYYIGIDPSSSSIRFNLNDPSPIESGPLMVAEWVHVACTYGGDTVKIYLDGVLSTSKAYDQPINSTAASFYIGDDFVGAMDDILIYNRGLSEEEVKMIYASQLTSTDDIFLYQSVNIFPNPTRDILTIQNNSEYPILSYALFNAAGIQVKKEIFKEELDFSYLPSGLYYLMLNFKHTSTTKKVMKQ